MFENRPQLPTGSRRNFYLLKIGAKSFRDGSQDICKDTESDLGPFAGFQGWNYPEASFISVFVLNNSWRIIMRSSLLCSLFCFFFILVSSPPRSFFRLNHRKKVRKRCSHSRFSFQAIILRFLTEMSACVVHVFWLLLATMAIFTESSNNARWEISQAEKEAELKSHKHHCRLSLARAP